jgi:carbonic anhydrase/acetyltransferase-like protein (isoleucine patch superfamily)
MTHMEMAKPDRTTTTRPLVAELGDPRLSARKRYMRMFVGSESLATFIRYEVLTSLLGPMPGAAGYGLRSLAYRYLFKTLGKGSVIGSNVTLRSPGRILIGRQVMIDDYAVLDAKGDTSSIELGDQILLGRNTILSCNEARIRVGNYVSIGPFCFFASKSHIDVGANVSIGSATHLMAGSHVTSDPDMAIIHQARISQGIVVEDNVWIGSGAKILDGVTIERNSIVGAGAVVSQNVLAYTTVLGNPARVVQKRKPGGAV